MRRIWKARIAGVGVLTPALAGVPNLAAARTVDIAAPATSYSSSVTPGDAGLRMLQANILALTPAEKLKIGGDRIRVAEAIIRSPAAERVALNSDTGLTRDNRHFLSKTGGRHNSVKSCGKTKTCIVRPVNTVVGDHGHFLAKTGVGHKLSVRTCSKTQTCVARPDAGHGTR
jgi:hypothetical protein